MRYNSIYRERVGGQNGGAPTASPHGHTTYWRWDKVLAARGDDKMFDDGTRGPNFAFAGGPFGAGGDDEGPWQPWARGERGGPGVFGFGPFPGGPYFGPHMLRHFARRFGFGPGGPRMFGRGD